jgi:hypothetical protein
MGRDFLGTYALMTSSPRAPVSQAQRRRTIQAFCGARGGWYATMIIPDWHALHISCRVGPNYIKVTSFTTARGCNVHGLPMLSRRTALINAVSSAIVLFFVRPASSEVSKEGIEWFIEVMKVLPPSLANISQLLSALSENRVLSRDTAAQLDLIRRELTDPTSAKNLQTKLARIPRMVPYFAV